MKHRISAFVTVGAVGFLIQIASLALMTTAAGWPYEPATAVAVQLAVLHNFFWHERWTWRDRRVQRSALVARFWRYELTTGASSIVSNVLCTALLVESFGIPALPANAMTVALMSAVNFVVSDRWIFSRTLAVATVATLTAQPASAAGVELRPETVAGWDKYVAATEARLSGPHEGGAHIFEPYGETVSIGGGTIHDWHGSTWIGGTTVANIVFALTHPGIPPPQEDVLESRVLARSGNTLDVYLKLVRRTVMTVTYDSEHRVTFTCQSPALATSRSVSTKIVEAGGADHGFLWKLNSYWRYSQIGSNVLVEVESLSLSREVPTLLMAVASPIISRIARESMDRTLSALRDFFDVRSTSASVSRRSPAS
jgi:putative flippase GtrA